MPFGEYLALVDNFNRASLGSEWLANDFYIYNNTVLRTSQDDRACLYTAQEFGPDLECTWQLLGGLLAECYCPHVMVGEDYFCAGYYVQVRYGLNCQLYKIDGGDNDIAIGSAITSPLFSGGDYLGIRKVYSLFELYRSTNGVDYTKIGEYTDSQFSDEVGQVGVGLAYASDPGYDNLYVGTIPRGDPATWAAAENAGLTAPAGVNKRLRIQTDLTGNLPAIARRLVYQPPGKTWWRTVERQ